jgi:hypothetical protein
VQPANPANPAISGLQLREGESCSREVKSTADDRAAGSHRCCFRRRRIGIASLAPTAHLRNTRSKERSPNRASVLRRWGGRSSPAGWLNTLQHHKVQGSLIIIYADTTPRHSQLCLYLIFTDIMNFEVESLP